MKLRLNILALITIIIGFFINEDVLGGAKYDFWNYHLPSIEHFGDDICNFRDYPSASGPLYYLVASSFFRLLNEVFAFRLGHIIIYMSAVNIWYAYLLRSENINNSNIALYLTLPLIFSPALRSTVIWPTTDSFTILMLISAIYSIQINRYGIAFTMLAAAFLTRQYNILWIPLAGFFWYNYEGKRLFQLLPLVFGLIFLGFLVLIWGGLSPVSFQHHSEPNRFGLNVALGFILLYTAPLMNWKELYQKINTVKKRFAFSLVGLTVLFVNLYIYNNFEFQITGGGIIEKILGKIGGELGLESTVKAIFYTVCFMIFSILINHDKRYIFIIVGLFYFALTTILFQKYGDPIIYIFVMLIHLRKEELSLFRSRLIAGYYFCIYLLSLGYYMLI